MNDIAFDRLRDVSLREAWAHEALAFTPWLAANIEHISEAIGVPLELTGTEVAVGPFSADILARNPQDDSVVLIENQLEPTDHTHLGQIMTYLAGLEAKTVVWIAPSFREPHLSAIRWLNQHTADGFSFFALRLRVVRIGESPFAPIFDVIEKPSGWDRRLDEVRRESTQVSPALSQERLDFWTAYQERHPDADTVVSKLSNFWLHPLGVGGPVVSVWLGRKKVGVFVRHPSGAAPEPTHELLAPYAGLFEERLDARLGAAGYSLLGRDLKIDMNDRANWPQAIDWLHDMSHRFVAALNEALGAHP